MIRGALLGLVAWCLAGVAHAAATPPGGAVASAHPLATQAGLAVLEQGGNAFDAAVAVAATLAVVEPAGSGLGGGGFWLLHFGEDGRNLFLDARETAPGKATADMYLDEAGEVRHDALRASPLAAGIPGIPAALDHLAKRYGTRPLADLLAPAVRVANNGFQVDKRLARYIDRRREDLARYPASAALFLPGGKPLPEGARLVQPRLARTLDKLAAFGRDGFYAGGVGQALVAAVRKAGGIWTREDLVNYSVIEREPLILDYAGWQIVTAPPPSSGGLVLGEILNMLSVNGYAQLGPLDRQHLLIESMRRAYYDRALYMGDADFVDVPSARLLSTAHARQWSESMQRFRATPSADLGVAPGQAGGGQDTTHFSIIDAQGNRVAATLSINYALGSSFVAGNTGVLLNNEMDDFVAKAGEPNLYGLVGGAANAIEPGKRMLSSMTPTFLEGDSRIAILGTPGGSRIITMVLLGMLDLIEGATASEVVAAPRFHHQYLPDEVQHEPEVFAKKESNTLGARGHRFKALDYRYGNMQVVVWDRDRDELSAASDPRGIGAARVVGRVEAAAPAM